MDKRIEQVKSPEIARINKNVLFWCTVIIISAMMLLRDVVGIAVSRFAFVSVATLVFVFCDRRNIYAVLAFIAPMAGGISYTYISAIALVAVLLKSKKVRISKIGYGAILFILFIELLSVTRGSFAVGAYLRFVGIFLVTYMFMLDTDTEYEHTGMIKMYLFGYIVAMVDILGQFLAKYSFNQLLSLGVRIGNTRQILGTETEGILLSYNPNELGTLCVLATLFGMLLFIKEKNPVYWVVIVFSSLIGITTQSRAFLVTYVISLFLSIILLCNSVKNVLKVLLGSVAVFFVMWFVVMRFLPNYLEGFINRFGISDLLNGRAEITKYYSDEMFRHIDRFVFGVGMQNYREKYGCWQSAHNAIQEVVITWGIIGLFAVIALFVSVLCCAKKTNKNVRLIQFIPFLAILLIKQSGQGFSAMASMLWFMVAYCAIRIPIDRTAKMAQGRLRSAIYYRME